MSYSSMNLCMRDNKYCEKVSSQPRKDMTGFFFTETALALWPNKKEKTLSHDTPLTRRNFTINPFKIWPHKKVKI